MVKFSPAKTERFYTAFSSMQKNSRFMNQFCIRFLRIASTDAILRCDVKDCYGLRRKNYQTISTGWIEIMENISDMRKIDLVTSSVPAFNTTMGTGIVNDNVSSRSELDELLTRVGRYKDKTAFATLFSYFAPRIKSFLLRLGTDMSTAEELSQEAMIMVWRRAETFDPSQAGASTWIFTIARNKRIDRLRKDGRPLPDMLDPAMMPEQPETGLDAVNRNEEEDKLRQAMKKLPEEQAKMIFAAYYEEKSHREIAEESGLPLGTVKSRIRLALTRLRANLDEVER